MSRRLALPRLLALPRPLRTKPRSLHRVRVANGAICSQIVCKSFALTEGCPFGEFCASPRHAKQKATSLVEIQRLSKQPCLNTMRTIGQRCWMGRPGFWSGLAVLLQLLLADASTASAQTYTNLHE